MGYIVGALGARWPRTGMPYRIDDSVHDHPAAESILDGAIVAWNKASPLRLVPDPGKQAIDYVRFVAGPTGGGGLSGLGRVGGRQDVLMDYDWADAPLALLHEIGHSAGLIHEHQRPDRIYRIDVKPIPANDGRAKGNIDISPGGVVVGPYDCRSLMHYTADDPYVGVHANPILGACTEISNQTGLTVGDRRALAHLAGTRYEILSTATWDPTWTHFTRFFRGFDEFLIAYSADDGTVHFDRVRDDGTTAILGQATWKQGWDHVEAIGRGNERFLLVHDAADGRVRIDRIADDHAGSTNVWDGTWSTGWNSVIALGATNVDVDHVLVYDGESGTTRLDVVADGGAGTKNQWQQQWTAGLDLLVPFRLDTADWRVLAYDIHTGRAEVHRISPNSSSIAGTYAWAPGWTHFAFHPPDPGGHDQFARFIAYNAATGAVHFDRMSANGWEIEAASTWSPGWNALVPVFLDLPFWGNTGFIVYRRSDGLVHFDRLY